MAHGVTDPMLTVYQDDQTWWPTQLRGPLRQITEDCRWFARVASQAKLDELWRRLSSSWEEFCVEYLKHPAEFVDAVIAGVAALGEEAPVKLADAENAGRARIAARAARGQEIKAEVPDITQEQISAQLEREGFGSVSQRTVSRDLARNAVMTEKAAKPRERITYQITHYTKPATAAEKIITKFGLTYAKQLASAIHEWEQ